MDNTDPFNQASQLGAQRIATILDGEAPPSPLPPAPAGPVVQAGGFAAAPAAAPGATTTPEAPGFLSTFLTRLNNAAPVIAKSLEDANARAATAESGPVAVAMAAQHPQRPKWLLWAILGGAVALLVVLFQD